MKYIIFYDNDVNAAENRFFAVSCQSKAEYIMSVLKDLGFHTDVISPSLTKNKRGFYKSKTYNIDEQTAVHLPATAGFSTILGKVIKRFWQWWAINRFVYSKIEENETVIVYHSVPLCPLLRKLKRRKKINLILHAEEIYSDVTGSGKDRKKEFEVFALADKFIVPTAILNEKINLSGKPFAVAHGDYKPAPLVAEKINDGRIHCVYAGTFNKVKGGAEVAVRCAEYLDSGFCLHVIGFRTNNGEKEFVCDLIEETKKKTQCEIIFDGEKRGEEFKKYIQKCHIGLSTQKPEAVYNNSSFPSKILTYMANGLAVVTVRIPVLEQSNVNDFVTYYDGDDPACVAKAVRKCADSKVKIDYADELRALDRKFSDDLLKIIR